MTKKWICFSVAAMMVLMLGVVPVRAESTELPQIDGRMQGEPMRQEGRDRQQPPQGEGETPPERAEGLEKGELPPEKPEGEEDIEQGPQQGGGRRGGQMDGGQGMLPVELVQEAVSSLTDTDAQAQIAVLLAAYEDALSAEKAILDAGTSDQTALETVRQTVQQTAAALQAALTELGIEIEMPEPSQDMKKPA